MLPAQHRLRRGEDFSAAVRRGARAGSRRLVVHLWSGDAGSSSEPARAGLVVSRAVGNAVRRNKVKRRLRALLASRIEGVPVGSALVVRALPPAGVATYDELAADLDSGLRRVARGAARR